MNTAQKASQEINELLLKHCPNMTNAEHIVLRISLMEIVERAVLEVADDIQKSMIEMVNKK